MDILVNTDSYLITLYCEKWGQNGVVSPEIIEIICKSSNKALLIVGRDQTIAFFERLQDAHVDEIELDLMSYDYPHPSRVH